MSETDKTFYSIGCYKTIPINAQLMSGARDPQEFNLGVSSHMNITL